MRPPLVLEETLHCDASQEDVIDILCSYQAESDCEVTPKALQQALDWMIPHGKTAGYNGVQVLRYATGNADQARACLLTRYIEDETWDGVLEEEEQLARVRS